MELAGMARKQNDPIQCITCWSDATGNGILSSSRAEEAFPGMIPSWTWNAEKWGM
jgi:hypothetical protein